MTKPNGKRHIQGSLVARWHLVMCAGFVLCAANPALAQDSAAAPAMLSPESEALLETYQQDYFKSFQPITANDMVQQIPGFSLDSGDGGRGFGEASSNLLINGRRLSTKSQSARDILSNIPANTVIRIEILDGASLDIPGLTGRVANIVRKASDFSGRWEYAARFEEGTRPQLLDAEIGISGSRGNFDFAVAFETGQFLQSEDGIDQLFDANGTVQQNRDEEVYFRRENPELTINLGWSPRENVIANLNGSLSVRNDESGNVETFTGLEAGTFSGQQLADGGEDEIEGEIGVDFSFPAGPGSLKLIGLLRREDSDSLTTVTTIETDGGSSFVQFAQDDIEEEYIARGEYSLNLAEGRDVQISGEYALNKLDSVTAFAATGIDPVPDPVNVEEDRWQGRVTYGWQVTPKLSWQNAIGAEYSTITVTEPAQEPRDLFRLNGQTSLSYQIDDTYQLRGSVERRNGQLNFGTFVASRSLQDGVADSGNVSIVPDRRWTLTAAIERTDDTFLSGGIEATLNLIEDPIEQILFADGSEGPGNIDSAESWSIDANATLLWEKLGIPGLRMEGSLFLSDSSLTDPFTGLDRPFSDDTEWSYDFDVRYDIPGTDYAVTLFGDRFRPFPSVRFDEVRQTAFSDPFLGLSFEHKNFFGTRLEISVTNLLDRSTTRERLIFGTDDRRLGPLTEREFFARDRGRRLSIEISDTF